MSICRDHAEVVAFRYSHADVRTRSGDTETNFGRYSKETLGRKANDPGAMALEVRLESTSMGGEATVPVLVLLVDRDPVGQ